MIKDNVKYYKKPSATQILHAQKPRPTVSHFYAAKITFLLHETFYKSTVFKNRSYSNKLLHFIISKAYFSIALYIYEII